MTYSPSQSYMEQTLDLQKLMMTVYHHRWVILATGFFGLALTFMYTLNMQPQYQTTAMLQVNTQSPGNVLAQGIYKLNPISLVDAELALIPTSYILKPVIKENGLNVVVSPHYFPVFGRWLAHRRPSNKLAPSFLGMRQYAWGGESIRLSEFSVAERYEEQRFKLVAQTEGHYQLFTPSGALLLQGQVNQPAVSTIYPDLKLTVSSLTANPGTEFFIVYKEPTAMSNELASQLKVSKANTDTLFGAYQTTGILQLQLKGTDPQRIVKTLDAILAYTTEKNIQQKTKQAQKMLEFLKQRLAELKKTLRVAEQALNQHHSSTNTLSLVETKETLTRQLDNVKHSLDAKRAKKMGLLQIYTPNHPLVARTQREELALAKKLEDILSQVRKFPLSSQKETNLLRNVKLKTNIYQGILKKIQQLELSNAGIVGDLTVLNTATPATSLPLHKLRKLTLGFLTSLFLAIFGVLLKTTLSKRIEDSADVEDALQMPVQAVIPYSKKQKQLEKRHRNKSVMEPGDTLDLVLARQEAKDGAIESLRNLQLTLNSSGGMTDQLVVSFLGSQSKIGKSFLALNFAQLLSDSGKKILLIDADLRKGRLHNVFFQSKVKGLGEYLEGEYSLNAIVRPISKHLSFIASGVCKQHPIELLQNDSLNTLFQTAKNHFDHIIIDTSPILAVPDGLLIANHSNKNLFVVSANDDLGIVKKCIKQARSYNLDIHGVILNYQRPLMPYHAKEAYYHNYSYS
ncbi:MAG: AAA family ATPase [Legionella sp.]|nr:AAA family ATPase [Legionella sp.]